MAVYVILLGVWVAVIAAVIWLSATDKVAVPEKRIPVYCVEREDKKAALTFNCAWTDEGLDGILDCLDRYDAACTFFTVGDFAAKYPDAIRKIYNRGHEIGNHSMCHADPGKMSYAQLLSDISRCNDTVFSITGKTPALYRAPSGAYTNDCIEASESLGMTAVQWSVDSVDWKDPAPGTIADRIISGADSGMIVLFHVGKTNTADALESILQTLTADGFELITVSELLLEGDTYVDTNGKQRIKNW